MMWTRGLASLICVAGLGIGNGCDRGDAGRLDTESRPEPGELSLLKEEASLKDADAYAARASEWVSKGDYDKALKDYDEAIRLKPNHSPFWNNRGFAWHMKGYQNKDRPAFEDRALS